MKVGNANVMNMMAQRFVLNKGDTIRYALGQAYQKYKGLPSWSHGGGDAGYRTYLLRFPEQHLSISVFSNLGQFDPGSLSYLLADAVLSSELKPDKPSNVPPPPPWPQKEPIDPKTKLSDFEGSFYSDELETTYTFKVENDTLRSHHQRHDDQKLKPESKDAFSMNYLGTVAFERDKTGKVTGFRASNGRVRNLAFTKH
jgi:hypothetical protein